MKGGDFIKKLTIMLPQKLVDKLKQISRSSLLGMYVLFLTGIRFIQKEILKDSNSEIGMPDYHGKEETGTRKFINSIEIPLDREMSFQEFVKNTKNSLRCVARKEKVGVIVAMEGVHEKVQIEESKYQIGFAFDKCKESFSCTVSFHEEQYSRQFMETLLQIFICYLEQVSDNTSIMLKDVEYVSKEEKEKIVEEFNHTFGDRDRKETLQYFLEDMEKKMQTQDALVFQKKTMSYSRLNERANQFAWRLRESGVKRDTLVGIMLERSMEMVVAMLAVLKAGGAFLPIDEKLPYNRISYMLSDSETKLLITDKALPEEIEFEGKCFDVLDESTYTGKTDNPEFDYESQDLVYVMYTSGTTGKPKAVMIEQHNIVNFIHGMSQKLLIEEQASILNITTISFDIFMLEIFWALAKGLRVVICSTKEQDNLEMVSDLIADNHISMIQTTPSRLKYMLNEPKLGQAIKELSFILAGGESFPETLAEALLTNTNARVFNMYGPTETTIWSCMKEITSKASITIGKPILNTRVYILDENKKVLPIGVSGEIFISGEGVARGYMKNERLTQERFVPDPFRKEYRMYRTGDQGAWTSEGEIWFEGRSDNQIKLGGYRIELGEIESLCEKLPYIKQAVALVEKDKSSEPIIAVYLEAEHKDDIEKVKAFLLEQLPYYMLPKKYSFVSKMPIGIGGKINRTLLSNAEMEDVIHKPAKDQTDVKLLAMWKEILQVNEVGMEDSFFELGGHSLKVIKLINQVYEEFHVNLQYREVFQNPTPELLALFIKKSVQEKKERIQPVPRSECFAVNRLQMRMLVLWYMAKDEIQYNIPIAFQVSRALDRERLDQAFQKVLEKYEILRTGFLLDGKVPMQKIYSHVDAGISYRQVEADRLQEEAVRLIQPFDLTVPPLFRVGVLQYEKGKQVILFDFHHIVCDGISASVIIKDFIQYYNGQAMAESQLTYQDFSVWYENKVESMETAENDWIKQFEGTVPRLSFLSDGRRQTDRKQKGKQYEFSISFEQIREIMQKTAAYQATEYICFLAAFHILLSKYAEQEDIIVGIPVTLNESEELKNVPGMYVNTVPVWSRIEPEDTIQEVINKVKEAFFASMDNKYIPFDELVKRSHADRGNRRNPLFDIMFSYQENDEYDAVLQNTEMKRYLLQSNVAKFDLSFQAVRFPEEVSICIEYDTSLFEEGMIERFACYYQNVLHCVMENGQSKVKEISIVGTEEETKLLEKYNATVTEYPSEETLASIFTAKASKDPDKIAVIMDGTGAELSYGDFLERADKIARYLRKEGLKREETVAVTSRRSFAMLIAIMGILKAGGAYVPVNLDFPKERIHYMLEDSGTKLLLVEGAEQQLSFENVKTVKIQDVLEGQDYGEVEPEPVSPDNLVYVMYTSGSTGRPKGVMIEHRSAINRVAYSEKVYPLKEDDVILQKTTTTFDVSVWELFWHTFSKAKVCLLKHGGERNPEEIVECVEKNRVTIIHFVPSMLAVFLEYVEQMRATQRLKSLRLVFASGEALKPEQVDNFYRILGEHATLVNMYGPTEAAVEVTRYECKAGTKTVPIGKPISNTRLYIVGKDGKIRPEGVEGELWISGAGVARGYLNNEELTKEKFIEDPFVKGLRVYKTGDRARWNKDGEIEYLGRQDSQVKIRGNRIELSEAEQCLRECRGIKEATVIYKEQDGEKRLYAYVTSEEEMKGKEIKEEIRKFLPNYMVPHRIQKIVSMPVTDNGKLDRKALDAIKETKEEVEHEEVVGEIEQQLGEIWHEILGPEPFGITDNFFDVGGNSILLIKLFNRMEKEFPGVFQFTELFGISSILGMASKIRERRMEDEGLRKFSKVILKEFYRINGSKSLGPYGKLQFSFNENMVRRLNILSMQYEITAYDIMYILYLQAIATATSSPVFTMCKLELASGKAVAEDVETKEYIDVGNGIAKYKEIGRKFYLVSAFEHSNSIKGKQKDEGIQTIFYTKRRLQGQTELLNSFDLAVNLNLTKNGGSVQFIYKTKNLSNAGATKLMNLYITMINGFLEME